VLVALLVALAAAASQTSAPTVSLGVYRGAAAPQRVAAFERWNGGQRAAYALDFLPVTDGWRAIADPGWAASKWQGRDYRMVYSVPLVPRDGSTLAAGAAGAYDARFASMARTLVAHGQGDAILRLGWEFNGDWFPWAASRDPAAFVNAWRHAVRAIRRVPGAAFSIDWAPTLGRAAIAPDRAYPGDAYVDVIGQDVYDQGWAPGWEDPAARWREIVEQPYGLAWHAAFAAAHGKPASFPEWGLIARADGHGGGDDPAFVRHMHDWIVAHPVLYHCYFEFDAADARHRLMTGQFPAGAAEFRSLFGSG
jgi:hypothetical protein